MHRSPTTSSSESTRTRCARSTPSTRARQNVMQSGAATDRRDHGGGPRTLRHRPGAARGRRRQLRDRFDARARARLLLAHRLRVHLGPSRRAVRSRRGRSLRRTRRAARRPAGAGDRLGMRASSACSPRPRSRTNPRRPRSTCTSRSTPTPTTPSHSRCCSSCARCTAWTRRSRSPAARSRVSSNKPHAPARRRIVIFGGERAQYDAAIKMMNNGGTSGVGRIERRRLHRPHRRARDSPRSSDELRQRRPSRGARARRAPTPTATPGRPARSSSRSARRSSSAAGRTAAATTAGWSSSTCATAAGCCRSSSTPSTPRTRTRLAGTLRAEDVVTVRGKLIRRDDAVVNPNLPTGHLELQANEIEILARAETPPFQVDEDGFVDESLRLKHRYLDLRRGTIAPNIALSATA